MTLMRLQILGKDKLGMKIWAEAWKLNAFSVYDVEDFSNLYDGTEESPCRTPCLQTKVQFFIQR